MTILPRTGRYILFLSAFTLISQVAVVTGQNKKGGVTVSYESLGSSRAARFTNSNTFPVRVEFSYQGTKARGSGEASGEDAVFVAANYFATYGRNGISITSVRITGVMRSDWDRGNDADGNNVNNACFIGQIFEATSANGTAVFINSSGRLGTMTSSRRFKQEIKPMGDASEALLALKPVTFRYRKEIDPAGTSQFGLVAEEVEKVDPALVIRDKDGKPYSVRYDQVNAMLLNEFLKEHGKVGEQDRRIVEQEATITRLAKQIETVVARLQRYDSKIQRVSDQVQMNSVERRTVASKQ